MQFIRSFSAVILAVAFIGCAPRNAPSPAEPHDAAAPAADAAPGTPPSVDDSGPGEAPSPVDGGPRFTDIDWSQVNPTPPSSFSSAKTKALAIYADHRVTLYCGCAYNEDKSIDPSGCGYVPRNNNVRARRIEWEHVVPASAFGKHRPCWTEDLCINSAGEGFHGRDCCAKVDEEFETMEAELQNLAPAIGELNGDRSDRPYGDIDGEPRAYGACDFEVDFDTDVAEPAEAVRGDVARAFLYMHFVYGADALPLSEGELERFTAWHEGDPADDWERERNGRIAGVQGVGNPLVE